MKKLLPIGLGLLAASAMAQTTTIESQEVPNMAVSSISDNGEWIVGEGGEGVLTIYNLKTGESWSYKGSGNDNDDGYITGTNREVSNDGTVIGEVNNIPSYWKNGKWNELKGYVRDDSGYVYAVVGAITPDGSMIVGGLGKGGGQVTGDDDWQMTYPCVWYRNDDGSYGDPVWLPAPEVDLFGRIPQYVHSLAVSEDGLTIGIMMRDGLGAYCQPIACRKDASGEWKSTVLGNNLLNPKNIEITPYPGDYYGPDAPNWEDYLTKEELNRYDAAWPAWYAQQEAKGLGEDQIYLANFEFVAQFMSEEERVRYEEELQPFLDEFGPWVEKMTAYIKCINELNSTGYEFEYNNLFLSPDGKYIYSSVKPQMVDNYTPVRIDIETGNYLLYPNKNNILVSSITKDYSVLGQAYDKDTDLYRMAYIFPAGEATTPVELVDYIKENAGMAVYDWMEDHMYKEVVTGITSSGAEQYDDAWCLGKPIATPDLTLISFASSTLYWSVQPAKSNGLISFVVNTGLDTGVESVAASSGISINVLPGACINVKGDVSEVEVYDLSGMKVYRAVNPSGLIFTGLAPGVYVIRATGLGETLTRKVLF